MGWWKEGLQAGELSMSLGWIVEDMDFKSAC